MKHSGETEVLHELVHDNTRKSESHELIYVVVSWTNSCSISVSTLHFISFLTVQISSRITCWINFWPCWLRSSPFVYFLKLSLSSCRACQILFPIGFRTSTKKDYPTIHLPVIILLLWLSIFIRLRDNQQGFNIKAQRTSKVGETKEMD